MKRIMFVAIGLSVMAAGSLMLARSASERPGTSHSSSREITIYRSATCSCCKGYEAYLRTRHFKVRDVIVADTAETKTRLRIPKEAWSCHSATIDGYVVEGHVPVEILDRLLAERPNFIGLALPGMPSGAPGMDSVKHASFDIVAFDARGTLTHYATY